jgi:hypothetical protein
VFTTTYSTFLADIAYGNACWLGFIIPAYTDDDGDLETETEDLIATIGGPMPMISVYTTTYTDDGIWNDSMFSESILITNVGIDGDLETDVEETTIYSGGSASAPQTTVVTTTSGDSTMTMASTTTPGATGGSSNDNSNDNSDDNSGSSGASSSSGNLAAATAAPLIGAGAGAIIAALAAFSTHCRAGEDEGFESVFWGRLVVFWKPEIHM